MVKISQNRIFELTRIFKGVANHRRVKVLFLLQEKPELSLSEIADELQVGLKTIAEHLRKLMLAGLIMKRHEGNVVRHALTERGITILKFCRIVE